MDVNANMKKMKYCYLIVLLFIISSCSNNKQNEYGTQNKPIKGDQEKVVKPELQQIIDSSKVNGSIVIYDPQNKVYYSNDFQWAKKGKLPASTFKITNSIIAIETGVVKDDSTLFKWNGEKRRLAIWEQDLIFSDAFHLSCVPCYQDIARRIGEKRMKEFLTKFNYGNIVVDSSNIDLFWLEGDSKISQFQQIDFLTRFYNSKLPIAERTEKIIKRLMVIEKNDFYTISGKTGWSIRNGNNNGWFVGYIETEGKVYFFATNVEPQEKFNMDMFPKIRNQITLKALKKLEIIK